MQRVIIIGGGISGLSAAYDLARAGVDCTLLEKQSRLGGVIETRTWEDCVLEGGPDSFLTAKRDALALIKELGLEEEVIGSNDHQRTTYILRRGRLVRLPEGVSMFIPSRALPMLKSPLLGWGTKLRVGLELLRKPETHADRSVSDFVIDHFGRETLDYLAEPLLSGVYGGDPSQLSIQSVVPRFVEMERKVGSLARAVRRERRGKSEGREPFQTTLKSGLGKLVEALAPFANVRRGTAETIQSSGPGWRVRADGNWIEVDHVIVTCPAWAAAGVVQGVDAKIGELLSTVPYSSSATVSLVFRDSEFDGTRAGFGFLVPKVERRRMLGCTFVGTKFPYRVPANKLTVRCFFGGTGDEAVLEESDDSLVALARAELRRVLGLTSAPIFSSVSRWPRSMAQYTVGHGLRIQEIRDRVAAIPGLHLAGNAYEGIGIPDCVRMGRRAAQAILTGAALHRPVAL
jgi:oxygen-dependent protoporphyrinogen oxidase